MWVGMNIRRSMEVTKCMLNVMLSGDETGWNVRAPSIKYFADVTSIFNTVVIRMPDRLMIKTSERIK